MTVSVNPIFLTVDEDLVTLNDPDEVASFSPTYNLDPSLTGAVSAITKASSTPYFTTPQFAVSPIGPDPTDLFNIGANTTDLKFVQNLGGTAYPTGGSGVDSGLKTSDGTSIYLFQSATTNNVIYGAIGDNAANPAAFILVLDEQVTGGFVTDARLWILQYATIQHDGVNVTEGDFKDLTDKVFVGSSALSQSVFSDFSDVPAGSPIFAMIADDTNQNPVDYLVTAYEDGAKGTGIQLNVSNQGSFPGSLASGSQNIGYGTALRLDLVTNGVNTYTQSEGQVDTAIEFDTHQNVIQAGFTIVQNQGNRPTDLKIELWDSLSDTADGHNFFTSVLNEASVPIDKILVGLIDPDTDVITPLFDSSDPADASHFVFSGNAITVLDLGLNYVVDVFQDSGFDRFTALNVTTTTFKGNVIPDTNAFVDIGRLTFTSLNTVTEVDEVGSHIRIDDSGPDVTAQAAAADTLVVDDDALNTPVSAVFASLFTAAFGSDGPAASGATVYSLSTAGGPSGVYDTATDLQVQLKLDTGVVHGYVTIAAVDTDVFTVSVNSGTAEVTLTQQRAIRHVDTGTLTDASQDPTNLVGTGLIGLVATVTDKDGDTDAATADITQALEFNDAQPSITTPADMDLKFATGQTQTENFTTVFGPDGAEGTVEIASFSNTTASLYRAVPADPVGGTHVDFYDTKGTASTADDVLAFHLDVTNTGYTVTVDAAPPPVEIPLDFESIASGGPQETLVVPLLDGSDSIIFDGLLNGQNLGPGDAADDLNPDNVGFGIKNGQASQINPGESFRFEADSGVDLSSLSFDIAGIGNIASVTANWVLYDDNGTAGAGDDILIDSGSTVWSLPKGNQVVRQHVVDDGTFSTFDGFVPGAGHTQAGESFDYGIVSFTFPTADANQGIRVLDFAAGVPAPLPPAEFTMTLVAEDGDGDLAITNLITVQLDPNFL